MTMTAPRLPPARAQRFSGLDGLRAIAVGLVLVYHLFPGVLPGGFLGVDVFFAISGFLITSLLLRELEAHGRIRLLAFWQRRARRLLPALALVLLVCTSLALLVQGDLLVRIGSQLAGASLFVSNWVFIANGADYFARDTPELFRNTWSLSIEEQFYILLPLLVIALWRLRSRLTRAVPLVVLGIASAALMFELSVQGADPTRIYFGSDTHTFGLLLGAAAATLLQRTESSPRPPIGLTGQILSIVAALAGFVTLGALAWILVEGSPASFQGGFQLATVAALVVIIAVTREGVWVGRALDMQPLRWIGERSYGIYLWHWPLLLLIGAAGGPWDGQPVAPWIVGILTLVATVLISAASYRFIEQPIRTLGIRGAVRKLALVRGSSAPSTRAIALTLVAVLGVTLPATGFAIATAPQLSSAAEAIARGEAMLDEGTLTHSASPKPKPKPKPTTSAPPQITPEGRDISAIGDSVMLASLPELSAALPDIAVDAEVSRGLGAGLEIVSGLEAQGTLRGVIVVGLGTNGPINVDDLESLRQLAQPRQVVLINAHGDREWIPGVNQLLVDFADSYRGVVVADWDGTVTDVPDALADDGIHPNPSGGEIYAESVANALVALQAPQERLGFSLPRR